MEPTKNLCAQIPESLHAKIREQQEAKGQTLFMKLWIVPSGPDTANWPSFSFLR